MHSETLCALMDARFPGGFEMKSTHGTLACAMTILGAVALGAARAQTNRRIEVELRGNPK